MKRKRTKRPPVEVAVIDETLEAAITRRTREYWEAVALLTQVAALWKAPPDDIVKHWGQLMRKVQRFAKRFD